MFLMGHDAECFAINKDGGVVSAIGKVGGTKREPSLCNLGALQEDNVMAELNIHPASTPQEFILNTSTVREELDRRLAVYDLKSYVVPTAEFSDEELNSMQAQLSGCDPDYNAWSMCENPKVELSTNTRYAGGHLHFGLDYAGDPTKITRFVRLLDCTIGVGMQLIFGRSDRSEVYGQIGAHRPKTYGVEYRSIDNSWLLREDCMKWMFKVAYEVQNYTHIHTGYDRLLEAMENNSRSVLLDIYQNYSTIPLPRRHTWK